MTRSFLVPYTVCVLTIGAMVFRKEHHRALEPQINRTAIISSEFASDQAKILDGLIHLERSFSDLAGSKNHSLEAVTLTARATRDHGFRTNGYFFAATIQPLTSDPSRIRIITYAENSAEELAQRGYAKARAVRINEIPFLAPTNRTYSLE